MKVKIGLEIHVQLNTQSKIFCGCRNPVNLSEEPEPNTFCCPTCLGLPGAKPRTNGKVILDAIKIALSLNCKPRKEFYFSRKTYFYPDMPRNFQITQYEVPLAEKGFIAIGKKKVRIKRTHIEEDPGKLVHVGGLGGKYVLVDYNRSGIPLVEVVTEPDLGSPEEAREFLHKLASILHYLGLYDPSSRAVFKSDANISIEGGARIEVKNITGTKEIEQALKYEMVRQRNMLKRGIKAKRETRSWDPDTGATQSLRGKEEEEEYGYIFEPDLTVIRIDDKTIGRIRKEIPELPAMKMERFVSKMKIPGKLSESIVSDPETAGFFENVSRKTDPKLAASWVAGPLKKTLNWYSARLSDTKIREDWFVDLLDTFRKGKITDRNAEIVIRKMVEEGKSPKEIIKKQGFVKVEGKTEIRKTLKAVIGKNPAAVNDYRAGEEKAIHFLVGQVMKESGGRIDPKTARKLLEKELK